MFQTSLLKRYDLIIAIILAGLTFSLCFGLSTPALYLNDEWITTNQVHQIFHGEQLIHSQGEYGRSFTGEMSEYFASRGNYLGYSLFLPILTQPAMHVIHASGDQFRLLFLVVWGLISCSSIILCLTLAPSDRMIRSGIWMVLFLFTLFFAYNLILYQPFPIGDSSPVECAALIFTNELLFAFMAPILFLTLRNLEYSRRIAVLGTVTILCCSTYGFWATTGKDHLLVAVLLSLMILMYSLALKKGGFFGLFGYFVAAGLLCWTRPEYGFFILIASLLLFAYTHIRNNGVPGLFSPQYLWRGAVSIAGLVIGLLPFFLNNLFITGNPLIPPQYLYIGLQQSLQQASYTADAVMMNTDMGNAGASDTSIMQGLSFFYPDVHTIWGDLYGLFISPSNGAAGILFICPVIIPAILFLIFNWRLFSSRIQPLTRQFLFFMCVLALATFISYLRVLQTSSVSEGSVPDMRYFSPVYLLFGLISVIALSPVFERFLREIPRYIAGLFSIIPIALLGIVLLFSERGGFFLYTSLMEKLLGLVLLVFVILVFMKKDFWSSGRGFPIIFGLLLSIPLLFQFMMIFLFGFARINGYFYWLPVFEFLFTKIITFTS